jgi:hypothetical protein
MLEVPMSHEATGHQPAEVRMRRSRIARFTGACYLSFILASVVADALGSIGLGEAEDVYRSIVEYTTAFRAGLVAALA